MKKRLIMALMVGVMTLTSAMPAFAAPKQMTDGNVFDAEYYAANNPDVVSVMGTGETNLYSHYSMFGKNEGRKPHEFYDTATKQDNYIKAKVAELGITYDPSRDAQLLDLDTRCWPVSDNWHKWDNWNEETQTWNCHYIRQDYTNDPLYYALAKALVEKHDIRLARINEMKAAGMQGFYPGLDDCYDVLVFDEIDGISFRDADREYLLNLTSNLMVDYVESIIGADVTWCQSWGSVNDIEEYMYLHGHKKSIHLFVNRAGEGFQER